LPEVCRPELLKTAAGSTVESSRFMGL